MVARLYDLQMTKPASFAGLIVLQYYNCCFGIFPAVSTFPPVFFSLRFLFREDNLCLHAQDFLQLDGGLKIAQIG